MHSTTKASSRSTAARMKRQRGNRRRSFRELTAFGIWADRSDNEDPVLFTKELRARMECGRDGG